MNTNRLTCAALTAALAMVAGPVRGQMPMGTAFTYQGQLKNAGGAVTDTCDLEFGLWDASSGGSAVAPVQAYADAEVIEGLLSVHLDFGSDACTGEKRWLEVAVKCSGDAEFVVLSPRQELTPAPYALHSDHAETADSVPGGIVGAGAGDYLSKFTAADEVGPSVMYESAGRVGLGTTSPNAALEVRGDAAALRSASDAEPDIRWTELVYHPSVGPLLRGGEYPKLTLDALSGGAGSIILGRNGDNVGIGTTAPSSKLTVNGIIESTSGGFRFPDGSLQSTAGGGSGWSLTGNAGTAPGTNFLGTTDNQALELKVSGTRVARYVPTGGTPQVIGGSSGNNAPADSYGVTIGGGGGASSPNQVTGDYSTIAGGIGNDIEGVASTIAGGTRNTVFAGSAAIVGGLENSANTECSFIGGGVHNDIVVGTHSVIGGGSGNNAMGGASVTGGGTDNHTGATWATVPGGSENTADGQFSFAAGRRADARHNGSFVWADHGDTPCSSQYDDQFRVCAEGGARFDDGDNWVNIRNDYTNLITTSTGARLTLAGIWQSTSDRNVKEDIEPVDVIEVLDRLSRLPLSTWRHRVEPDGVRHMGPMAQDFHAAFELGDSDTSIGTVDADGVALAAIQALHAIAVRQSGQIAELQERIVALENELGVSAEHSTIGGVR